MFFTISPKRSSVEVLAEGLRAETLRVKDIHVSTLYPGYISTEMNAGVPKSRTPFIIGAEKGCKLMVQTIEGRPAKAFVPRWLWVLMGWFMRNAPLRLLMRLA